MEGYKPEDAVGVVAAYWANLLEFKSPGAALYVDRADFARALERVIRDSENKYREGACLSPERPPLSNFLARFCEEEQFSSRACILPKGGSSCMEKDGQIFVRSSDEEEFVRLRHDFMPKETYLDMTDPSFLGQKEYFSPVGAFRICETELLIPLGKGQEFYYAGPHL